MLNTKTNPRNIVLGQSISSVKKIRSRELRRDMTLAEQRLWEQLRAKRLYGLHFRRQQIIDGFIVDFYCHSQALVIEIDGAIHAGQVDYDTQRDKALQARGLRILRFRNGEVESELQVVLEKILAACQSG